MNPEQELEICTVLFHKEICRVHYTLEYSKDKITRWPKVQVGHETPESKVKSPGLVIFCVFSHLYGNMKILLSVIKVLRDQMFNEQSGVHTASVSSACLCGSCS
jgi:hypothetical protein